MHFNRNDRWIWFEFASQCDHAEARNWNTKKSDDVGFETSESSKNLNHGTLSQFDKNDVTKFKEIDPLNRDWSTFEESYQRFKTEDFHNFLISGGPFEPIGPKSGDFDGKYFTNGGVRRRPANSRHGSEFVIRDGQIANTRTGGGRITVESGHVDANGSFFIKYFRQWPNHKNYLGSDIFVSGDLTKN